MTYPVLFIWRIFDLRVMKIVMTFLARLIIYSPFITPKEYLKEIAFLLPLQKTGMECIYSMTSKSLKNFKVKIVSAWGNNFPSPFSLFIDMVLPYSAT